MRPDADLKEASVRLKYEIDMLCHTLDMLLNRNDSTAAPDYDEVIQNALLESFLIHARNLLFFFYTDSSNDKDMTAWDFFDDRSSWRDSRPSEPESVRKMDINRRVAHPSWDRVTKPKLEWDLQIAQELAVAIGAFSKLVNCSRVDKSFIECAQEMQRFLRESFRNQSGR